VIAPAQDLPALQGEGDVALTPQPVVEALQVERVTGVLLTSCEQIEDLQLPHLVTEPLAGVAGEEHGLFPGCRPVHRDGLGELRGGIVDRDLAEREREVDRPDEEAADACHPRDLVDQVIALCRYRNMAPKITREMLDSACTTYFVDAEGSEDVA
jgi:hypothetical protein